MKNSEKYMLT